MKSLRLASATLLLGLPLALVSGVGLLQAAIAWRAHLGPYGVRAPRSIFVLSHAANLGAPQRQFSYAEFVAIRDNLRSSDGVVASVPMQATVTAEGRSADEPVELVSENFFEELFGGFGAVHEGQAIVSDSWMARAKQVAANGPASLVIANRVYHIAGTVPTAWSTSPNGTSVWIRADDAPTLLSTAARTQLGYNTTTILVRFDPAREPAVLEEAHAVLSALRPRSTIRRTIHSEPLAALLADKEVRRATILALNAVALATALAVLSLIALAAIRASRRRSRFRTMVFLGLHGRHLLLEILIPSVLAGIVSCLISVVVVEAGLLALRAALPRNLHVWLEIPASARWAVSLLALGVTAFIVAIADARALRIKPDANKRRLAALAVTHSGWLLGGFSTTAVGATFLAAGMTLGSLMQVDLGFTATGLVVFPLRFASGATGTPPELAVLVERTAAAAGLANSSVASSGLLWPGSQTAGHITEAGSNEPIIDLLRLPQQSRFVGDNYFSTIGTRVDWRTPDAAEAWRSGEAVVVSASMAAAIGRRYVSFYVDSDDLGRPIGRPLEVAGTVPDIRHQGPRFEPTNDYYFSAKLMRSSAMYLVAGTSDTRILSLLSDRLRALPGVGSIAYEPLSSRLGRLSGAERFAVSSTLPLYFLTMALLLSAMAATVVVNIRAREKEIAVRSALGASVGRLRWEAIRGPAIGLFIGVVLSLASSSFVLDWAGRSAIGLSTTVFFASAVLTVCASTLALLVASRSLFRASLLSLLRDSRST